VIVVATVLVALALATCLLGLILWREQQMPALKSVQIRFGRDLTADAAQAIVAGLSGLPHRSVVVIEIAADETGIAYRLHAASKTLELVQSQIRGVLPSSRFETSQPHQSAQFQTSLKLGWRGSHPVLQSEHVAEAAATVLSAFTNLRRGERLRLLWILTPTRQLTLPDPVARNQRRKPVGLNWLLDRQPSQEHRRALRSKYAEPMLRVRAFSMAGASGQPQGWQLLNRLSSVLRARDTSWGQLRLRRSPVRSLDRLVRWSGAGVRLSASELIGLIGLPIDAPRIPGLTLESAPQLMPAIRVPQRGRVFARSDWGGMEDHLLAQPVIGGLNHGLIVGPTGSGKTHLLANLVTQDLRAGRGCLVVDGKGDLCEEVLRRVPEHRRDVIVLDPASDLPVPGLRVFAPRSDPELTADLVLGIFAELFADSWGVRSARWLRAGLLTLAHDDRPSLANLPLLFSDDQYRRTLVGRIRDPLLASTWADFESMSMRDRSHQLSSPLQKVSEIIGRRVVRAVLAQPDPKLDMADVLRNGKVVVVTVPAGQIGGPAARLLGALVVHELFQAVQGRASLPPEERRSFFAYIDEPKVLAAMPIPLDSLYELARSLGVGLMLGVQSLSQLPQPLQRAVLTNAATIVGFRQAADDAALMARELRALNAEELQGLGRFEVAIRLGLGPGDTAPVATGVTLPLPDPISNPEVVRRISSERYGIDPAVVDQEFQQRRETRLQIESPSTDAPVGRIRRST